MIWETFEEAEDEEAEDEEELEHLLRLDFRFPKTSAARRPAAVEMSIFIFQCRTYKPIGITDTYSGATTKKSRNNPKKAETKIRNVCVRLKQ